VNMRRCMTPLSANGFWNEEEGIEGIEGIRIIK